MHRKENTVVPYDVKTEFWKVITLVFTIAYHNVCFCRASNILPYRTLFMKWVL